ncbi:MAG TPA: hypothetical protein VGQ57_09665 [Polyangiaceae bacterium]|jgi:hypothetical protein|nr:hypothetical protein [Polyangiaceae bacterium]
MRGFMVVVVLTGVSACAERPAPNSPPAEKTASGPGETESDTSGNPSLRAQREAFMQSCMPRALSPDYCECGFEQFRAVFKDVDLTKDLPQDDPHFKELGERTLENCASKLREDQVQSNFVKGCVGGDERKRSYCACAWPALRKSLAVSDFVLADLEGPRFLDAKKGMVVACKGKFPAEVARSDFMTACTKDQTTGKVCECLWKKLKAKFTMEELAAGTAEIASAPGLAECRGKAPKGASLTSERLASLAADPGE